jgi:hypothetical protein
MQSEEGEQPPRREASLEHTPGAARRGVPGGPSTNKSDVGSTILPGGRRAGREVVGCAGSDS